MDAQYERTYKLLVCHTRILGKEVPSLGGHRSEPELYVTRDSPNPRFKEGD